MANLYRSDSKAEQVKALVSMEDILRHYGFPTARRGRIPCPLHNGKDNNFSYRDGYFKCFVCGEHGSVIDFVMKLFGIDFKQAVIRIDSDFGLGLTEIRPDPGERSKILEARRREAERAKRVKGEYAAAEREFRYWWFVKKYFAPVDPDAEIDPLYAEALKRIPALEYYLDENLWKVVSRSGANEQRMGQIPI
jgi:hypothetical protein